MSTANEIWTMEREEVWGEDTPYSKVFKNLKKLHDKFYNSDSAEIQQIIADTKEVFNLHLRDDPHRLQVLLKQLDTKAKERLDIMENKRVAARPVLYELKAAPPPSSGDPPDDYGLHDSGLGAP